ncbi:MAG: hypothetical protein K0A93_08145 [Desulfuromonadaceae bacterium]|nr:hypothetical protein [Desulfuromonadaceae bacterium]
MLVDRYDRLLWGAFILLLIAIATTTAYSLQGSAYVTQHNDRNLERKITERARFDYLADLYAPVTAALEAGDFSHALLALEEVQRSSPDEAYGQVLKGVILSKMGAIDAALESLAAGIKQNGNYIDRNGSLSYRKTVIALVANQLPLYAARVANDAEDTVALTTKRHLHYLQSRLAGGCE